MLTRRYIGCVSLIVQVVKARHAKQLQLLALETWRPTFEQFLNRVFYKWLHNPAVLAYFLCSIKEICVLFPFLVDFNSDMSVE